MNILKNKLVTYKKLVIYLVNNQYKKNSFNLSANTRSSTAYHKNIKFEIKLYLIGLSFNRFLFNFDKMLFILCIITNFLYFLSFQSPRVLFVGEAVDDLSLLYRKSAKDTGQLFFKKLILPGSIANIKMVEVFYYSEGKALFTKHLDCVLAIFCNPIKQILTEIKAFSIPVIGLVEFNAENIDAITYPLVCPHHYSSIRFFIKYFSKILNARCLNPKITFFNKFKAITKKSRINNNNKRHFSKKKKIEKKKFLFFIKNTCNNSLKYILYGLIVFNKCLFFFYNRFFLDFVGSNMYIINYLEFYNRSLFRFFFFFKSLINAKNPFTINRKLQEIKTKKMYLAYKKMARPPWWKSKKQLYEERINAEKIFALKRKKRKRVLRFRRIFWKKFGKKGKGIKKKKFNRIKWAEKLRKWLETHNVFANFSLTTFEKPIFLRDFIIRNLKQYGISTDYLFRKEKSVVNDWYPYIGSFAEYLERKNEKKKFKPVERLSARDIPGTWEYKKWHLFTPMDIPKKRKRLKKLKFAWPLRRLIGLNKNTTPTRFFSNFRPRANILKQKVLVKKLVYYYYSFSTKKKLRLLLRYNARNLNHKTIDTTKNLMNIFSLHLCIFVLRCRLTFNISNAKSLITKGQILVNGKVIFDPGYILKDGDIIQVKHSRVKAFFKRIMRTGKPKKFRKKRFFFRLSRRARLPQIVLGLQSMNSSFKISSKYHKTYYKFYWEKRKYSYTFFKIFKKNFNSINF